MKKIKIILILSMLVCSISFITGCNIIKSNEDANQNVSKYSVADTLVKQFEKEIKTEKDMEKVAKKLAKNEVIKTKIEVSPLQKEEYLSGFKKEIKGYRKVVTMRPIISSIPFVAYLFETDDVDSLVSTLKENADLRWNICTEADEMKISKESNYVFFIMSPKTFDEE